MTLNKKLVLVNVAADNQDAVVTFYEKFFGIDFAVSLTDQEKNWHAPIDENGIDMTIGPKHNPQQTIVNYYAVDDLKSAIAELTAVGGKVLWGPGQLPIAPAEQADYKAVVEKYYPDDAKATKDWTSVGQAVLLSDPAGNGVGLVQVAENAQTHFQAGPKKRALDDVRVAVHQASAALGAKHAAAGKK